MSALIQNNSQKFFWLALIAGYSYVLILPFKPYEFNYLLKAVPVLMLALLAFFLEWVV